jgi:opacity protein-like surface antigen
MLGSREIDSASSKINNSSKEFTIMKRMLLVFGAIMLCGIPVLAQEYPKAELFMGYQWIRFGTAMGGNPNVNFNGGGGSIAYNFNPMLGLKAEFTGSGFGDHTVTSSNGVNTLTRSGNMFTYMFGPQVTLSRGTAQPFGHLLLGGAYSNYYGNVTQNIGSTSSTTQDAGKQAFALAFGGGLDVKVSKSIAIRTFQIDYLMTRFSGRAISTAGSGSAGSLEISNQSSMRLMFGVNIHLGEGGK